MFSVAFARHDHKLVTPETERCQDHQQGSEGPYDTLEGRFPISIDDKAHALAKQRQ